MTGGMGGARLGAGAAAGLRFDPRPTNLQRPSGPAEVFMGSLIKKRRKKMSKHKYRKRLRANRHKRK
jgi:hypothetical protein